MCVVLLCVCSFARSACWLRFACNQICSISALGKRSFLPSSPHGDRSADNNAGRPARAFCTGPTLRSHVDRRPNGFGCRGNSPRQLPVGARCRGQLPGATRPRAPAVPSSFVARFVAALRGVVLFVHPRAPLQRCSQRARKTPPTRSFDRGRAKEAMHRVLERRLRLSACRREGIPHGPARQRRGVLAVCFLRR